MRVFSIGCAVLGAALCSFQVTAADLAAGQRISAVEVLGAPAPAGFETRAGETLDPAKVRNDVKRLYETGRYQDIQVESADDGDAVRVVFKVRELRPLRLRKVSVEPATPGIRVDLPPNSPIDARHAQEVADGIIRQLQTQGYQSPKVDAKLLPIEPGVADLAVHIDRGNHRKVEGVALTGHLGIRAEDVRKALKATRARTMLPGIPHVWHGWRLLPDYSEDALQSDVANVRSLYYQQGYFDADVRVDSLDLGKEEAQIGFRIESGPRYAIRQLNVYGADGLRQIQPAPGAAFPMRDLCNALLVERRKAERAGVVDFAARIELRDVPNGLVRDGIEERKWTDVSATIQRGPAYRVGRIEFRGNHVYGDLTVRRALLLDEGRPLDEMLLRRTLARLNRTGLFEPLSENNVAVNTYPNSDQADLTISLKEKKRGHWMLSGPAGPMSVAGPFEAAIGTRLPAWGRGIFELSTYTASLTFMAFPTPIANFLSFLPNKRFLLLATLNRPVLPGQRFLSGFLIAPQLGWQGMLAGYGISQIHSAMSGLFQSDRSITPGLPVTITHAGASDDALFQKTMYCEMPKTGWDWIKQVGGLATNLMFAFTPF